MARAATFLLLTCALGLLAACGGGKSQRDQVEAYIQSVSAVQQRTNPAMVRANKTYAAFARGQLGTSSRTAQLVRAQKSIRAVRAQVAGLHPPATARTLHARLLGYYDASADLAYETTLLGTYEPAAQAALRPLPRLNKRLQRDLAAGTKAGDQVTALSRYNRGLDRVLTGLRRLHPPPILLAAHNDQIARLAKTRALAGRLATALRKQDAPAIAKLLLRFRQAGASGGGDVQRLSAAAVRAYEGRLRGLNKRAAAVERERRRLEQTLK
jgi:hypothetical protein